MGLPKVTINVTEEVNTSVSALNSFVPLVILKAVSGPIGETVSVSSESDFIKVFGEPTASTPAAYGMRYYIKNYGKAFIRRLASSSAAFGTASIKATKSSTDIELISIQTKYKTASRNASTITLNVDTTNNKIYLTSTIDSKVITSIKETLAYATDTAEQLETALGKIITSFNESQSTYILTKVFTSADNKPDSFTSAIGTIADGNSGLTTISNADVISAIAEYDGSDLGFDSISTPEFEDVTVVSKLASVADDNSFMAIASITGSSLSVIESTAAQYPASTSLALYAPNVKYSTTDNIIVPASVAVLSAYQNKDTSSKWLAPAGVSRATLSLVKDFEVSLTEDDLDTLYSDTIPVNGIKKISGTGFVVWGQKTTSQETTSYLDRINVARLVKYLTKEVNTISYGFLFEPITDYTYKAWILKVNSLLEEIKNGNGLSDYKTQMDDTLNTDETKAENKLIGKVRFKPLEAAEYIEINFVVTDEV